RALLAPPCRRGQPPGPPGPVRSLRLQHRGGRRGTPVVLTMDRPTPNAMAWLLLSVAVIGLDQWSKAWVLSSLPEYTAVPVIEGFWNWYRTYNTGAAFSFLADAGGWQVGFFTVLAFAICGLLCWWLWRIPRG